MIGVADSAQKTEKQQAKSRIMMGNKNRDILFSL